jgi:hypothetical protein
VPVFAEYAEYLPFHDEGRGINRIAFMRALAGFLAIWAGAIAATL